MNQPFFKFLFTIFLFQKKITIDTINLQRSTNNIDKELLCSVYYHSQIYTFNFTLESIQYDQSINMVTVKNLKLLKTLLSEKILELNPAKNVLKTFNKLNN
jgi:hypothetical protein